MTSCQRVNGILLGRVPSLGIKSRNADNFITQVPVYSQAPAEPAPWRAPRGRGGRTADARSGGPAEDGRIRSARGRQHPAHHGQDALPPLGTGFGLWSGKQVKTLSLQELGSGQRERVCVLFIGTQFSILYTSMYSPIQCTSWRNFAPFTTSTFIDIHASARAKGTAGDRQWVRNNSAREEGHDTNCIKYRTSARLQVFSGNVGIWKALKAVSSLRCSPLESGYCGGALLLLQCRRVRTRGWGWLTGAQLGFVTRLLFQISRGGRRR